MNIFDIRTLSNEEKAAVVCLYYSQLKKSDARYKDCFTNIKVVATKYGYKSTTLKNNKQAYDALFDNGRDGWHDRPIEKRSKLLYDIYLRYAGCQIEDLANLVDKIVKEAQKEDKLFFSIKTKNPATVKAILSKQSNIEFDGLNILQNSLKHIFFAIEVDISVLILYNDVVNLKSLRRTSRRDARLQKAAV